MDMLLAGYRRFRSKSWLQQRQRFEELADQGQQPQALVLGCIDSRADPGMIFDAAARHGIDLASSACQPVGFRWCPKAEAGTRWNPQKDEGGRVLLPPLGFPLEVPILNLGST